jgi:hypothetical protein
MDAADARSRITVSFIVGNGAFIARSYPGVLAPADRPSCRQYNAGVGPLAGFQQGWRRSISDPQRYVAPRLVPVYRGRRIIVSPIEPVIFEEHDLLRHFLCAARSGATLKVPITSS